MRAPPASANRVLRTRALVSGSSGVIAYNPLSCPSKPAAGSALARTGVIRLPRPEKPVGNELTHAGGKDGVQGLPGVFLRLAHGVGHLQAVRERCGDCRGQGAARAVIVLWAPLPAVGTHA